MEVYNIVYTKLRRALFTVDTYNERPGHHYAISLIRWHGTNIPKLGDAGCPNELLLCQLNDLCSLL